MKSGGDKSHTYLHEFDNGSADLFGGQDDHEQLRDILAKYKHARIVISYYDCAKVRSLYEGWTFINKSRVKHLHNQTAGRGGKVAPELLLVNGMEF